jgi:hypothetical protein
MAEVMLLLIFCLLLALAAFVKGGRDKLQATEEQLRQEQANFKSEQTYAYVPRAYPRRQHGDLFELSEWLEKAESVLQAEHNTKPTHVRPGAWTKMYIRGMTPEEAAKHAAGEALNRLPISARILSRR